MGDALITIQLIGACIAFALMIYVYLQKSSEPQKILFAGSVFVFVNMLGYYFELTADTVEAALIGIKMEYMVTLGSCFFCFCLYLQSEA